MKRILFTVIAAAAVLAGCTREDALNNGGKSESKVFTCTIQNDEATKTTIDGERNVLWEDNDKIQINGIKHVLSTGGGTSSGEFTPDEDNFPTPPYRAFYADYTTEVNYDEDNCTYVLPATYTYNGGSFRMPMYAFNSKDSNLSFKNICGVLKLVLTPDCGLNSVSKITVTSNNKLNGKFKVDEDNMDYAKIVWLSDVAGDGEKGISITCSCTLNGDGTPFYIPVPPGDHALTITLSDGANTRTASMSSSVNFERNKLYTMDDNFKFKTTTTVIWDSSLVSEENCGDVTLTSGGIDLIVTNNYGAISDFVTNDSKKFIHWNGQSKSDIRNAKFTADYDGTVTVKYKSNSATATDRIVAVGKSVITTDSTNLEALLSNDDVYAAGFTNGSKEMSISGEVKAGDVFIYNAKGGCTILSITYTYTVAM